MNDNEVLKKVQRAMRGDAGQNPKDKLDAVAAAMADRGKTKTKAAPKGTDREQQGGRTR